MKKKWWKLRTKVTVIVFTLIGIGTLLWFEEVQYYSKKLLWTEFSLHLARANIRKFHQITGRNPHSLGEINQYAQEHTDSGLRKIAFGEYLTNTDGNKEEYTSLNGQGGLFYNERTGEVKVNLTKPVKHYLRLYFGKYRNEIPADW